MATSDSRLNVPNVTLQIARSAGDGSGAGEASGSGINVAWTGKDIGDTLTITTSTLDFTAKANANPLWYVDPGAEGTVNASPLSRLNVGLSGRALGNLDTVTKYGPNGSARAELIGSSPDWRVGSGTLGPVLGAILTNGYGAGDHIRLMSRWRRNFDGLDAEAKEIELAGGAQAWNIKRWRWWANSSPNNNLVFAYGQFNEEAGRPRITPENSGSGSEYQAGSDLALYGMKKNQWVSEVVEILQSSAAGVGDGFVRHIADGQEFLFSNVRTYDDDGSDGRYFQFVMEQWQYLYTDTPFRLWHDFIYLDDTPHAVVITDKPNWGAEGATIDPVIPTSWSGNEIAGKRRSSGAGWLYVINGSGTVLNNQGVAI